MANYSSLSEKEIIEILQLYGLELKSNRKMKGGAANSSYLINDGYILTILDNHTMETAKTLTRVMQHVYDFNVPTQQLCAMQDGSLVCNSLESPIILKIFIDGKTLEKQEKPNFADLGRLLAKIHQCPAPSYEFETSRKIPKIWNTILQRNNDLTSSLFNCIEQIEQFEEAIFNKSLPSGLIHGDLFADNVIVENESKELYAIDWETCSQGPFIYDIAITLVGIAKNPLNEIDKFITNDFLEGYQRIRSLEESEFSVLLHSISYAAAMLSFHRYYRHVVRYPNPEKFAFYEEQMYFSNNVFKMKQTI